MALIKQSHWFLTLVTIVCFGLLHKTTGRVSIHFSCVISLLPALGKDKLPLALSSFQPKHPSLLPAQQISFTRAAAKAFAGVALHGCWAQCWGTAGASQQQVPPVPNPSSAPVLCTLTGTHLITMHTAKACAIPCDEPFEIKANQRWRWPFVRCSWPSGYLH